MITMSDPVRAFAEHLPEGWEILPFEDCLSQPVRNGIYKKKEFHGRGAKVVNMGELFGYDFIRAQDMKRIEVSEKEGNNYGLLDGDLLFARRSLVLEGAGKCSLVCGLNELTTFESSIIRARPDPTKVDSRFLFYLFTSPVGRAAMASIATRTAVSGIRGSELARLALPIPDLPTQRRIAGILSAYDDLIENNLRRIRILEEMAQSLYREWFVHFRFPGHESVPLVDSTLGPIPDGWEAGTLGDLVDQGFASLQTGPFGTQLKASDYTDEGTPVINVRNIGFGTLRPEKLEFLPPDKAETHKRHMLQTGDIVFGRKGAVERHLLIGPGEDGWIQGSDCIRLRITGGPITPRMLSVGFREESHQRWMMNQCSSGATMASLNQDILCRIPLTFPPPALVSRFDTFVTAALDHVDNLALKNQALRQTRDLLLPKLLSA